MCKLQSIYQYCMPIMSYYGSICSHDVFEAVCVGITVSSTVMTLIIH